MPSNDTDATGKESSDVSLTSDDAIHNFTPNTPSGGHSNHNPSIYKVAYRPQSAYVKDDTFSLDVDSRTGSAVMSQNASFTPDSLVSRRPLKRQTSKTIHRLSSVDSCTSGNLFMVSEVPGSMASLRYQTFLPRYSLSSTGTQSVNMADCLHIEPRNPMTEVESNMMNVTSTVRRYSLITPMHSEISNAPIRVRSTSESCVHERRHKPITWVLDQPIREDSHAIPVPKAHTAPSKGHEVKLTATLFIVILAFMISWAPITVVNCLETFSDYAIPQYLDRITIYLVFLQSAINPVIYGALNKNFKKGFRKIFCFLSRIRYNG